MILPYPNNPTGAVLDRPLLERLRDVFVENDLIVISDEIYSELTYTRRGHTSIASLPACLSAPSCSTASARPLP